MKPRYIMEGVLLYCALVGAIFLGTVLAALQTPAPHVPSDRHDMTERYAAH